MPDFTQQDQQYTLQEVASHCGLAPYIIRYWEIHFPELGGTDGKRNSYSNNDVALIWRIKKLLYCDHLDIEQAKKQLARERSFPVQYPAVKNGRTPVPEAQSSCAQQSAPLAPATVSDSAASVVSAAGQSEPVAPALDHAHEPAQVATPIVRNDADERIAELVGELNGLRVQHDALQRDLDEMTALAEDLSRERDEAVKKLTAAVAERDALSSQAQMLSGNEAALTGAVSSAKHERDEALAKNHELVRENDELRARLEDLVRECNDARREGVELRAELAATKNVNGASQQAFADLTEINERLQGENVQLKINLEKIISQLKELSTLFKREQG